MQYVNSRYSVYLSVSALPQSPLAVTHHYCGYDSFITHNYLPDRFKMKTIFPANMSAHK